MAENEGNEIPAPTPQHKLDIPENATCSIIRIDMFAYRAATDTRAIRKNVSLPAWMATLAGFLVLPLQSINRRQIIIADCHIQMLLSKCFSSYL